jgi:hypothetical protein
MPAEPSLIGIDFETCGIPAESTSSRLVRGQVDFLQTAPYVGIASDARSHGLGQGADHRTLPDSQDGCASTVDALALITFPVSIRVVVLLRDPKIAVAIGGS